MEIDLETIKNIQNSCFRPDLLTDREQLIERQAFLAYYTNATTACSIIERKEFWLRSISLMNDYSEVSYGINLVVNAYQDEETNRLLSAILAKHAGISNLEFEEAFDGVINLLKYNTYAMCLSEMSTSESESGKLSMWRGYGGGNGTALLFEPKSVDRDDFEISVALLRMKYLDQNDFTNSLREMIRLAYLNQNKLSKIGSQQVLQLLLVNFSILVLQTKHPAFYEEQEWRLIVNESIFGSNGISYSVENIDDTPQKVFKLSVQSNEINLQRFLHSVVVGPSPVAPSLSEALSLELKRSGMENVRVVPSLIPYRDKL